MPFRRDEAKGIAERLGVSRLKVIGPGWPDQLSRLEVVIAVAAWRQQSLDFRAAALLEALDAMRDPILVKWGTWDGEQ